MKTDLEVEIELDLRPLGKVIIFRDKQTDRSFLLYIDKSGALVTQLTFELKLYKHSSSLALLLPKMEI